MRVFLTGFMAAGKTAVGRELAALLDASFVDLDRAVEESAGETVRAIFEHEGEEGFRKRESRELARLSVAKDGPLVVATGGGTPTVEENRRLMAKGGRVVWLDVDFEVLSARLERTAAGLRPLFRDRDQARRLLAERRCAYRQADLRVEVLPEETAKEVAARILRHLGDESCAT